MMMMMMMMMIDVGATEHRGGGRVRQAAGGDEEDTLHGVQDRTCHQERPDDGQGRRQDLFLHGQSATPPFDFSSSSGYPALLSVHHHHYPSSSSFFSFL